MLPTSSQGACLPRILLLACLFAAAAPSLAQQPVPAMVTQPVNNSVRTILPGNLHPLARSEFDQGEAPPELPLKRMLLVLRRSPRQEAELQHLIENQQYKKSASYHKWLTPANFGARFGPANSDVEAVTGWLRTSGFEVHQVSSGRSIIEFSGTAGLVKQAFGTAIHRYLVNGQQHWANANNPSIPTALAPVVAGINSLHNFRKIAQNNFVGTYSELTKDLIPQPDFTFPSGQYTYYAVVPYDFAAIYDLLPLWNASPTPINGAGQTIAIVGRTDIDPTDPTDFWNLFGLDGVHAPQPTLIITHNGPAPGINGDEGEADIDVEWSGAAAPAATINFVTSESTETTDGVDLSALYIVDNNLAPVMSESYGLCEFYLGAAGVNFYGSLWEQAAAQGISVFVSSGDNGAAGCDYPGVVAQGGLAVNGLASTPFNAAVGGTDFNEYQKWSTYWNPSNNAITQQSVKGYIPETTWNDSCTNSLLQTLPGGSTNPETNCNNLNFSGFLDSIAGSGGKSKSWPKPTWQTGTQNDNARDLPDISLFASNGFVGSFYVVCQKNATGHMCNLNTFAGYGGTSVASPAFAGIMALVNQKTGSPQGVPGLVLYKLVAKQPNAFHDIPSGSTISVPCVSGSPNCTTSTAGHSYGVLSGYNTGTAYDLATGLGSVDAANLVNNWDKVTFTPSATSLTLNSGNPVNVTHGASVPVSITVTPATPSPTGDVALLLSPGTPPGNPGVDGFTLSNGAVNSATTLLPGGTYSVLAHYAGNTTYGGSYSNSVSVTVNSESSKTFPNLVTVDGNGRPTSFSASSVAYGSGFPLFRVDVGDSAASVSSSSGISSGCSRGVSSCPTGAVTLTATGTALNGQALSLNNEGYAEIQTLFPGSYSVSANYPGDASYGPSNGTTAFTVTKAPTTALTCAAQPLQVQYATLEPIGASIATTSTGIAPTGTFQFSVDGSTIATAVPIYESGAYNPTMNPPYAWADAQTTAEFPSIGNHTLSAEYSGDNNYASSTGPSCAVVVGPAQASFGSWGWGVSSPSLGQTVNPSAQLNGAQYGVAPTGTMTFYDNNTVISGTVTYTSSPSPGILHGTIPYTFTAPGTHNLTVSYSGDSNYTSANVPVPNTVTVLGPVSVTAGAVNITSPGQSGSTSLTISPNGGFIGTVSLSCSPAASAKETTCGFTSGSSSGSTLQVNVSGSSVVVTFNVTTTAPHALARAIFPAVGGTSVLALAGITLFLVPVQRRRQITLAVAAMALTLSLGACGGGSSGGDGGNIDPGTTPGTYSFTVVATTGSGASAVSLSTPVMVTGQ